MAEEGGFMYECQRSIQQAERTQRNPSSCFHTHVTGCLLRVELLMGQSEQKAVEETTRCGLQRPSARG